MDEKCPDGFTQLFHNHIDSSIQLPGSQNKVHFMGIYGFPALEQRQRTWQLIKHLHNQYHLPWLLGREGATLTRFGNGQKRKEVVLPSIFDAIAECNLTYIGFLGSPFTWCNNRKSPDTIRCRLGRVCANDTALSIFPSPMVHHIPLVGLDHCPFLLKFQSSSGVTEGRRGLPFRFE